MTPREILEVAYTNASDLNAPVLGLSQQQREWAETIVQKAESQKAVLAATLTSLLKKIVTPQQDVRLHKVEMSGGYSGRSFDTQYVTRFLHEKMPRLAMKSGSGWLTRSVEQNHSFGLDFTGKIQDKAVKNAFLFLQEILALLIRHAQAANIVFAPTPNVGQVTIQNVIKAL